MYRQNKIQYRNHIVLVADRNLDVGRDFKSWMLLQKLLNHGALSIKECWSTLSSICWKMLRMLFDSLSGCGCMLLDSWVAATAQPRNADHIVAKGVEDGWRAAMQQLQEKRSVEEENKRKRKTQMIKPRVKGLYNMVILLQRKEIYVIFFFILSFSLLSSQFGRDEFFSLNHPLNDNFLQPP